MNATELVTLLNGQIEKLNKLRSEKAKIINSIDVAEEKLRLFLSPFLEYIKDERELKKVAAHLLYGCGEFRVKDVAFLFRFDSGKELREWLGKCRVGRSCEGCGDELTVSSRNEYEQLIKTDAGKRTAPEGYYDINSLLCQECRDKLRQDIQREESARTQSEQEEYNARLQGLKSMAYRDYLKTPEWNETRKSALYRARYRCQVCNRGETVLDVHHRTYENRGEELPRDLIVLCRGCHETFHEKRELA